LYFLKKVIEYERNRKMGDAAAETGRAVGTDWIGQTCNLKADSDEKAIPARTIKAGLAADSAYTCNPSTLAATDTPRILALREARAKVEEPLDGPDFVAEKSKRGEAFNKVREELIKDIRADANKLSLARDHLVRDTYDPTKWGDVLNADLNQVNCAQAELDRDVRASLPGPEVEDSDANNDARRIVIQSNYNPDVSNSVWGLLAIIKVNRTPADYAQMLIRRSWDECENAEHWDLVKIIAENYRQESPTVQAAVLNNPKFKSYVDKDVDHKMGVIRDFDYRITAVRVLAEQIKEPYFVLSYLKSSMRYIQDGRLTKPFGENAINALEGLLSALPEGKELNEGRELIRRLRLLLPQV
jgi:hypothetical protein